MLCCAVLCYVEETQSTILCSYPINSYQTLILCLPACPSVRTSPAQQTIEFVPHDQSHWIKVAMNALSCATVIGVIPRFKSYCNILCCAVLC